MKLLFTQPSKKNKRLTQSELRSFYTSIMKSATKSVAEKEDEAITKLIKKKPKKKPPRKDLKKNRVEIKNDKDLQGVGRGDKGDPDLSRRDRDM